jgi:hypothetical protein
MEHAHEMLTIECVNRNVGPALFWNSTREDIKALKAQHRDFAYVWEMYLAALSGQEVFNSLWECWMLKFTIETKNGLIDYALAKYGQEKRAALESAYQMRKLAKRFGDDQ